MTFDLSSVGWDRSFATAFRQLSGIAPAGAAPAGRMPAGAPPARAAFSGVGVSNAVLTEMGSRVGLWGLSGLPVDDEPGRVLRIDRGVYTVLTSDGVVRASLAGRVLAGAGRDPLALPCVGDWLVVRTWPDKRLTVEAVLPRRSVLLDELGGGRRGPTGRALVANMDVAAIVEPIGPVRSGGAGGPDRDRLARWVAWAGRSGARPLVVLTMADRVPDPDAVAAAVSAALPDVPLVTVSAHTGYGLERLRRLARSGRTLALFGSPGVGRSTLVNTLLADADGDASTRAAVAVSGGRRVCRIGAGRAPGACPALVPLPGAGALLDAGL